VQELQPPEEFIGKADLTTKPISFISTVIGAALLNKLSSTKKVNPFTSNTLSLSLCSSRASASLGPPQPAAI